MSGANRKSIENLGKILDNQLAKLDQYNALIAQKCGAPDNIPTHTPNPAQPGAPAVPAVDSGAAPAGKLTPWLLIGGVALVLMFTMKK